MMADGVTEIVQDLQDVEPVERDHVLAELTEYCDKLWRQQRAEWIDAFTMRMGELAVHVDPAILAAVAAKLVEIRSYLDPEKAADAEFLCWPLQDDGPFASSGPIA